MFEKLKKGLCPKTHKKMCESLFSGGGGVLIVSDNNGKASHSCAEIMAAVESGKLVYYDFYGARIPLSSASSYNCTFNQYVFDIVNTATSLVRAFSIGEDGTITTTTWKWNAY